MIICLWVTRRVVSAQIMGCSGNNGECTIKTEMTKAGSKKKDDKINHLQLTKQNKKMAKGALLSVQSAFTTSPGFASGLPHQNSICCNVKALGCQGWLGRACRGMSKWETAHSGVCSRKEINQTVLVLFSPLFWVCALQPLSSLVRTSPRYRENRDKNN